MSPSRCFIGLDVGTTHTKGALVDGHGTALARSSRRHVISSPRPGWAEHDAERDWWGDSVTVIRELLKTASVDPETVGGIFVSGMSPSLILTDNVGTPLRQGITQSDTRRPQKQIPDYGLTPWDHMGRLTCILLPLLWVKENESELYSQTRKMFFAHSFVTYRLTGRYCTDISTVNFLTPLFDPKRMQWDRAALDAIGLRQCAVPELLRPAQVVGNITQEAAEATGLPRQTQVLMGTGDYYLSLMAAGVREVGDAMLYYGSVGVMFCLAEPLTGFLEKPFMLALPHDPILSGPVLPVSGILLEWFSDHFGGQERKEGGSGRSVLASLDAEAAKLPPGSQRLILLPHFYGERIPTLDPKARGVLFGLSMHHEPVHVYRAILESFGYAMRHGVESLAAKGEPMPVKRMLAAGGGARSAVWRQIMSDIMGYVQVSYGKGDETLAGAYLAGLGAGYFANVDAFYNEWLGPYEVTLPNKAAQAVYEQCFAVYKRVYEALRGTYETLEAIEMGSRTSV